MTTAATHRKLAAEMLRQATIKRRLAQHAHQQQCASAKDALAGEHVHVMRVALPSALAAVLAAAAGGNDEPPPQAH